MILTTNYHQPVLRSEIIQALKVGPGKKYIDATLGGGGYTDEILRRGGVVLCIDTDQDALDFVESKLKILSSARGSKFRQGKDVFLEKGNFADLKVIAGKYGFDKIAGLIFDLGMSTHQIEKSGRGFTYRHDEALDMRMDREGDLSAEEVINSYSGKELYEIFTKYGEELNSRAIADALVRARSLKKIKSTGDLAAIIKTVTKGADLNATLSRVFQAIRIVVNKEIENLDSGLRQGIGLLDAEGVIAVVSYHSLEDRLVKMIFKHYESRGYLNSLTKSPVRPGYEEISRNSRSRSAKLRIASKI